MDVSGFPSWKEFKDMQFECSLLENFVSSWIRIKHHLPFPFTDQEIRTTYSTTNDEYAIDGGGILSISKEEMSQAKFSRSNAYST